MLIASAQGEFLDGLEPIVSAALIGRTFDLGYRARLTAAATKTVNAELCVIRSLTQRIEGTERFPVTITLTAGAEALVHEVLTLTLPGQYEGFLLIEGKEYAPARVELLPTGGRQ